MSRAIVLIVVLCAVFACGALGAIPEHLVRSLPGYTGPLPSRQYSGYIQVNDTSPRYLHYWFVESENDPATDPVVLWLNGGPGCSSLDGYFYEQGPFHFVDNPATTESSLPSLELNPYRWNKVANMIFLEAPAGVGYSYYTNPNDRRTGDNKTAADNYQFLVRWFAKYPEYSKNRFFISGESYAGVYIPMLAEQVMIHNEAGESNIALEGLLVGNGCIGNVDYTRNSVMIEFFHGHALYSDSLYKQIKAECPNPDDPSKQCSLLSQMYDQVGDYNGYDIYSDCSDSSLKRKKLLDHYHRNMTEDQIRRNNRAQRVPISAHPGFRGVSDDCGLGILAGIYLNTDEVRAALHVESANVTGDWSICAGGRILYWDFVGSILGIYPSLISKYRVLIYNGDVDPCVPYLENERWTSSLGYEVAKPWHQWLTNGQVAGYATSYEANGFQFITVLGAGHMVPEYRPVQALQMFTQFLNNQPF